jgi:hypothetical protein
MIKYNKQWFTFTNDSNGYSRSLAYYHKLTEEIKLFNTHILTQNAEILYSVAYDGPLYIILPKSNLEIRILRVQGQIDIYQTTNAQNTFNNKNILKDEYIVDAFHTIEALINDSSAFNAPKPIRPFFIDEDLYSKSLNDSDPCKLTNAQTHKITNYNKNLKKFPEIMHIKLQDCDTALQSNRLLKNTWKQNCYIAINYTIENNLRKKAEITITPDNYIIKITYYPDGTNRIQTMSIIHNSLVLKVYLRNDEHNTVYKITSQSTTPKFYYYLNTDCYITYIPHDKSSINYNKQSLGLENINTNNYIHTLQEIITLYDGTILSKDTFILFNIDMKLTSIQKNNTISIDYKNGIITSEDIPNNNNKYNQLNTSKDNEQPSSTKQWIFYVTILVILCILVIVYCIYGEKLFKKDISM